jgi:hypothetical protein
LYEDEHDQEDVSPDDSISQVRPQEDDSEGSIEEGGQGDTEGGSGEGSEGGTADSNAATDEGEEEEYDEGDEVDLAAQEEAVAEAKVQEYLARQAELALRREDVEKAKAAGDWHPDEIFLFERLAMRSFEELIPAEWQVDFPTLPQILFTDDLERTFVNFQCVSSYRGAFLLRIFGWCLTTQHRCQGSPTPPQSRRSRQRQTPYSWAA